MWGCGCSSIIGRAQDLCPARIVDRLKYTLQKTSAMKSVTPANLPCPCGSKKTCAQCCAPLHEGTAARDAEALMRSRYSAYALGLSEYIQRSWHHSTRPASIDVENEKEKPRWIGLQIKRHEPIDTDHARVEFIARYKVNGRAFVLHEISRFVREGGHWFYVDGEVS
jgi:SEC-C motif-containing protein